MKRKRFVLKYLGASTFAVAMIIVAYTSTNAFAGSKESNVATRNFELVYKVKVSDVPQNSKRLRMWIPYIASDEDQSVTNVTIDSPFPVKLNYDTDWGNGILFINVENPEPKGFELEIRYKIQRREHKTLNLTYEKHPHTQIDTGLFEKYLSASSYGVINSAVKEFTKKAVEGRNGQLDKARGIYDFIIDHMNYDKNIPGWGNGDVNRLCLLINGEGAGAGNCTDFHSLFASMMRVEGIPVKFEMGFPINPNKKKSNLTKGGYHCWAKFFIPDYGWIPVDISEARKDLSKKEYYWGTICENRIRFSVGRDIVLTPPQQGAKLNYFGPDPYIEVDGKAFDGFERWISYSDF